MRIPLYWKQATYTGEVPGRRQPFTFVAWGWSFQSAEDADDNARDRVRRIYERFVSQQPAAQYAYLDTPMREEIIETVERGGKEIAVITRNRYGALVLNAASVLFADVDLPEGKPSGGGLGGLFKMFSKPVAPAPDATAETIQRVNAWAQANPQHSFRLYRTAAGLRLLFTDQHYEATDPQTDALLASLGSDPLYRTLTRKQESFRARLTPKPWRSRCPRPPNRYPWQNARDEQTYRNWERTYEQCSRSYRTAELIQEVGAASGDEEIQTVIDLHDQYALRGGAVLA